MKTRINLLFHRRHHTSPFQHLLDHLTSACETCFILFIVMILGLFWHLNSNTEPPLKRWADLPLFEQIRDKSLARTGSNPELIEVRQNFLINEKIKDPILHEQFQQAGLSHLLAISGGQTAPAAATISFLLLVFVIATVRKISPSNMLNRLAGIRLFAGLFHTLVIFFLVGLYQSSGALNRAFAKHLTHCARAAILLSFDGRHTAHFKTRCLMIASPWCLGWFLLQNPMRDLSFLLSALGALTSTVVAQMMTAILHLDNTQIDSVKSRHSALPAIFTSRHILKISVMTVSLSLTSALMSLLTIPFWPAGNILDKVFANIVAGPCVAFVITPAALGICVAVLLNFSGLERASHALLDWGLEILLFTARTFSSSTEQSNLQIANHETFMTAYSPYTCLAFEVLILSILSELLRTYLAEAQGPVVQSKRAMASATRDDESHSLNFSDKIR